MNIRPSLAIIAGRLGGSLSRALRLGGGTSLPGAIALKIDPRVISTLAARLDRGCAMITATNGKTTTANMLADVYRAAGLKPVHNAAGANLAFGVATALMSAPLSNPQAKLETNGQSATIGLFEVDEAVVKNIVTDLDPAVLTVGNIFRDQLDRFGEVDQTAKLIGRGIARLDPRATLVLNADDPRVAALAKDRGQETVFFGIEDDTLSAADPNDAQDSKDCLLCGRPLVYERRYFSHMGVYTCNCGFSRPRPAIYATALKLSLRVSKMRLVTPEGEADVALGVPALYNVYNALAATATARSVGIGLEQIVAGLEAFKPTFGRFESIDIGGKRLNLMLIKNPTGFNQAIEALNIDDTPKNVMIAINDNLADGTDVSWLWDADVENLRHVKLLLAGGIRAHDMALRLKYAGFDQDEIIIEPNYDRALDGILKTVGVGDDVYVLSTYTAMLDIRKKLQKLGKVTAFWEPAAGQSSPEEPAETR